MNFTFGSEPRYAERLRRMGLTQLASERAVRRYTGLTTLNPNFPTIRIIHFRLLQKSPS
jgi:hypothetical protein